jgi:hypothetical protein
MHAVQRNLACINRAPLQAFPRQLPAALQQLPHRVLLRATPSTTCTAKIPWSGLRRHRRPERRRRFELLRLLGGEPPPPFPRGWCSGILLRLAVYKPPPHKKKLIEKAKTQKPIAISYNTGWPAKRMTLRRRGKKGAPPPPAGAAGRAPARNRLEPKPPCGPHRAPPGETWPRTGRTPGAPRREHKSGISCSGRLPR